MSDSDFDAAQEQARSSQLESHGRGAESPSNSLHYAPATPLEETDEPAFPWLNPEWPIPHEVPPSSEQPNPSPGTGPGGYY